MGSLDYVVVGKIYLQIQTPNSPDPIMGKGVIGGNHFWGQMDKIQDKEILDSIDQIRILAAKLGWTEYFDLNGELILHSGITYDEDGNPRFVEIED